MSDENKPLSEMLKPDLQYEIDLYAKAGILPEDGTDLTLKPAMIAWLEEQRNKHGVPHVITAEDLELPENKLPMEKAELKKGDVVLLPLLAESPLKAYKVVNEAGIMTEDGVTHPMGNVVGLDPESDSGKRLIEGGFVVEYDGSDPVPSVETESETQINNPSAVIGTLPPRYVYRGKLVKSYNDKIVNGKSYVEVHIEGESFVLPQSEFDSQVKIARSND